MNNVRKKVHETLEQSVYEPAHDSVFVEKLKPIWNNVYYNVYDSVIKSVKSNVYSVRLSIKEQLK